MARNATRSTGLTTCSHPLPERETHSSVYIFPKSYCVQASGILPLRGGIEVAEGTVRAPRRSLTASQLRDNPDAIELLAILQGIASDGRVRAEEIHDLQKWLDAQRASELPAIAYLRECVETVLEDGHVSDAERRFVQDAVEKVMPKEHRDVAALLRREAKAADRAEDLRLAELNQPLDRFDFMVAGVLHQGRARIVDEHVMPGDRVDLIRQPNNGYSRNAILVRHSCGAVIGYVPETEARRLAPKMDAGARFDANVKKVLAGRTAPIPVVWGELYAADATWGRTLPPDPTVVQPSRWTGSRSQQAGASLALVVALLAVIGLCNLCSCVASFGG